MQSTHGLLRARCQPRTTSNDRHVAHLDKGLEVERVDRVRQHGSTLAHLAVHDAIEQVARLTTGRGVLHRSENFAKNARTRTHHHRAFDAVQQLLGLIKNLQKEP